MREKTAEAALDLFKAFFQNQVDDLRSDSLSLTDLKSHAWIEDWLVCREDPDLGKYFAAYARVAVTSCFVDLRTCYTVSGKFSELMLAQGSVYEARMARCCFVEMMFLQEALSTGSLPVVVSQTGDPEVSTPETVH